MAAGAGFELQAREAVGAGGEGLQELAHRPRFPPCRQHVEGEAVAHVQQTLHRPLPRHRHRETRRVEAGLAHPAGHHRSAQGRFSFPLAGRDHAEGAHQPAQGLHGGVAAALLEAAAAAAPLAAALFGLQLTAQGDARFLQGSQGGWIGAELHPDRLEGEAEAAIAELVLQQVDRLAAPAEAAEHPHRFLAISFRQHRAQGRDDRGGGMAPEGGGADQQGIAGADRGDQLLAGGELAVEALHPHTAAGHPLGQGIGDGGGVAVGAGVQQRDGEAGAALALPPAAVIGQQAAPAGGDRRTMARRDRADRQCIEPVHHRLHLAGHRRHQTVVVVAAILLSAAEIGLGEGLAAEVGGEELAAHQQSRALLEGHQAAGPAGRGHRNQGEAVTAGQLAAHLLLHHIDRGQGRQGCFASQVRRGGLGGSGAWGRAGIAARD